MKTYDALNVFKCVFFQSNVLLEPIFLWSIMSVRAAGWGPTRTRRASWSVSPVLKEPPQPTCTPAASVSAKVGFMHKLPSLHFSVCKMCDSLASFKNEVCSFILQFLSRGYVPDTPTSF